MGGAIFISISQIGKLRLILNDLSRIPGCMKYADSISKKEVLPSGLKGKGASVTLRL